MLAKQTNKSCLNNQRLKQVHSGFTLAEVLITLGIIGIVAAMTIPTLIKNTLDMQYKSAWKKEYSTLEQASKLFLQDNTSYLGVTDYANALQPYLRVTQYCTQGSTQGCWLPSNSNYYLKQAWGNTIAGIPNNSPGKDLGGGLSLILADGTTISTAAVWPTCNHYASANVCGWILVDVNGFKAPNTVGRDVYGVWVLPDRITPIGSSTVNSTFYEPMLCGNGDGTGGDSGYGCSAAYLTQ